MIFLPKDDENGQKMHQYSSEVVIAAAELIKACLILELDVISGKEDRIIKRIFALLKPNQSGINVLITLKIKLVEVLSAFLYKGY